MSKPTDEEATTSITKWRWENGMCVNCGNLIYQVENTKFIPITLEGSVQNGRCLYCYPGSLNPHLNPSSPTIDESNKFTNNKMRIDNNNNIVTPPVELFQPRSKNNNNHPSSEKDDAVDTRSSRREKRDRRKTTAIIDHNKRTRQSISNTKKRSRGEKSRYMQGRPHSITNAPAPTKKSKSNATNGKNEKNIQANEELSPKSDAVKKVTKNEDAKTISNARDSKDEKNIQVNKELSLKSDVVKFTKNEVAKTILDKLETISASSVVTNSGEKESKKEKEKVEIVDFFGTTFKGYLDAGNLEKGNGSFEHKHEDDYPHLNGKISVYIGEIVNGKMEGKGKLVYASGSVTEGDFKNGATHGNAVCIWQQTGWKYSGQFFNDERCGQGKYEQIDVENGEVYEGEWKADKFHGRGKLKFAGGDYVEGIFEEDEVEGEAKYVYSNGSVYQGNFKKSLRSGKGQMSYAYEDEIYSGYWSNDKRNGYGIMLYADGSEYNGTFRNDHIFNGRTIHPDGTEKKYKNGKILL